MTKQNLLQSDLWKEHPLPEGEAIYFNIGSLNLWCEKSADELWIAYEHSEKMQKSVKKRKPPEDISWTRWVFKGTEASIRLTPVFPDMSVVVKPEYPFKIIQGAKAKIYIWVPVWIRIEQANAKEVYFTEIPSEVLSKTWFGLPTDGELCYWVTTAAQRKVAIKVPREGLAICPVFISNDSKIDLDVQKLALRVRRLSIFEHENQLWADEMRMHYEGQDTISKISITGKAPKDAPKAKLVSASRIPMRKSLARKTFSSFKELPGIELFYK